MLLHLVGVSGNDHLIGAQAKRVLRLVRRRGEDDGVRPERMSEFDAHVAQPAETDDANLLALGHVPMAHGRIGGDARAKQRSGAGKVEIGRDAQNEPLVHDDAVRVAAVGDGAVLCSVRGTIGENHVRAELLQAGLAIGAGVIGVHQAANADQVAGFELA